MPEGKSAELLYAIARLSEYKGSPVPLRGLEDAMVLLKSSNLGFHEFSFALIDDKWYSSDMLDAIDDLREWGYIRIKSSGFNGGDDVLLNVSPSEVLNTLSKKVGLSNCEDFLLKIRPYVIANKMHEPIVSQLAHHSAPQGFLTEQ